MKRVKQIVTDLIGIDTELAPFLMGLNPKDPAIKPQLQTHLPFFERKMELLKELVGIMELTSNESRKALIGRLSRAFAETLPAEAAFFDMLKPPALIVEA